jgi:hypothetical protein
MTVAVNLDLCVFTTKSESDLTWVISEGWTVLIMHTKLIFQVSIMLMLPSMLLILRCLTQILIRGRILLRWCLWDDVDQPINTSKNPLHVPNGPMIRSKTKALNALVLMVSTKSELKGPLEYQEEALVHLIHMQEGSNTTLFRPWGEDSKENKRILLQHGNNMGDYLFILFLGLMGCMEGRGEYFRFGPVLGQNK